MSKQKEIEKQDKKIKRLYTLVWFLACPLAYVIVLLAGFEQINIVYWTLLIVPVLLGVFNISQVPPVTQKVPELPESEEPEAPSKKDKAKDDDELVQVTSVQRAKLIALALKAPCVLALPILVTLITHMIVSSK